jgi:hypothetical protein
VEDGGHVSNRGFYDVVKSELNMETNLFFSTIVPKSFWRIFNRIRNTFSESHFLSDVVLLQWSPFENL